jgi:hypothetical protein
VEAEAELPQPSEAVRFLFVKPSRKWLLPVHQKTITAGVLQAAVAVAEPRAALISEAEGLQPSVAEHL